MAKMITLSAYDCVEVDGYLYFFSREYNFLFKLEITTGEISIVDSIPDDIFAEQLIYRIVSYKRNLYFAPMKSNKIWQYSLDGKLWKGYELKELEGFRGFLSFSNAVLHNEKIYFFGRLYPAVVVFDLKSEEIQYFEKPYTDSLKELSANLGDAFFIKDCVMIDNCVYMASSLCNVVLKFNMDSFDYSYITVGNDDNRYSGIDYDGSYFYLYPRKKKEIIRWDGNNKFEAIKLKFLKPDDSNAAGGVFFDGKKVVFYGDFADETDASGDYKICTKSENYYLKKRINEVSIVSLNTEGELKLREREKEYKYTLHLEEDVIIDYLAAKIKTGDGYSKFFSKIEGGGLVSENEKFPLELLLKLLK